MTNKLHHLFILIKQIVKLPVAHLHFDLKLNSENVRSTYELFTRPHPKYKIFKNKSIGVALIEIAYFNNLENYLNTIKGKNSGLYHAKKAMSKGYMVSEINRNKYIDEIHEINTSIEFRQGRLMDSSYLKKQENYESTSNHKYYGVLNIDGKLMAYCGLCFYGNFAAFSQIIGYRNNDGIMHLLVTEIVAKLIENKQVQYLMYDTFYGAQPGLQKFKQMLYFKPYRAKYSIS